MPADNVHGFRAEVIAVLKQLHSGMYRLPGGNFLSAHEWRDAIGDLDKRPPIMDPVWNAVQPNDVGTDEFLTCAGCSDVDPYITVNAGFGDAWSAAQLVEYVNGAATTPMGRLRAANGHPQPYKVKLWGIGNEPWGDWQLGFMPLEQFALKHNLFAKAMRRVDPDDQADRGRRDARRDDRLQAVEAPQRPDRARLPLSGRLERQPAGPLPRQHRPAERALLLHQQPAARPRERREGRHGPQPLVEWDAPPATQVRVKYEHYQEYLKRIPALKDKPVPISLDEWAYIGAPPQLVQGGAGLRLGLPRDVPPLRPVPAGRLHVRHVRC